MSLSAAGLALRTCKKCHQVDDHPRCHRGGSATARVADLPIFHMDCHAQLGCPVCLHQLEGAEGLKGEALRAHLLAKPPLTDDEIAALTAPTQEG